MITPWLISWNSINEKQEDRRGGDWIFSNFDIALCCFIVQGASSIAELRFWPALKTFISYSIFSIDPSFSSHYHKEREGIFLMRRSPKQMTKVLFSIIVIILVIKYGRHECQIPQAR